MSRTLVGRTWGLSKAMGRLQGRRWALFGARLARRVPRCHSSSKRLQPAHNSPPASLLGGGDTWGVLLCAGSSRGRKCAILSSGSCALLQQLGMRKIATPLTRGVVPRVRRALGDPGIRHGCQEGEGRREKCGKCRRSVTASNQVMVRGQEAPPLCSKGCIDS